MHFWRTTFCGVAMAAAIAGCEGGAMEGAGGLTSYSMGATQGGLQGMQLVRELIAKGVIPPADAFTVEGMFSEHDLPLEGAPCSETLCLSAGVGVAPTLGGETAYWTQVGLSSSVNPDTYVRPSQTLIAVVDVSGSMRWGYGDDGTPGEVARAVLHQLRGRLGAQDRLGIVIYSDKASTFLPVTSGADQETLEKAINNLTPGGSTNMEAGLRLAYEVAGETPRDTDEIRLVLFTDVQPNVGGTTPTDFVTLAKAGAEQGIYLTVLALGVGMGPEVLVPLSAVEGANGFELFSEDDVEPFFAENWPWFLTPIAYHLHAEVVAKTGFSVAAGYGFANPSPSQTYLDVATLFLSKKRGALLVEFTPAATDVSFSTVLKLSYLDAKKIRKTQTLTAGAGQDSLDERGQFFAQPSVGKTVALAVMVSSMKKAAFEYSRAPETAEEIMAKVVTRLEGDAAVLGDPALDPEVKLAKDMLALVEQRAKQGTLYGERR